MQNISFPLMSASSKQFLNNFYTLQTTKSKFYIHTQTDGPFNGGMEYVKKYLPHNLNNNGIESKLGDGTIVAAFRFAFAKFTNGQRRKWNN